MYPPEKQHVDSPSLLNRSDIAEYLQALKGSEKFGPQVVCHKASKIKDGEYHRLPEQLSAGIRQYLIHNRIEQLYSHQIEALNYVEEGRHLLAATPTASGKSMIYNLPVINGLINDPSAHALYMFPLKALANDQLKKIDQIYSFCAHESSGRSSEIAAIYDGDTSSYRRRKLRDNPPGIMITTPDMLHLSILPFHENWGRFFRDLKYIIIDEVHTYRGVFGSHMSWAISRLKRIASYYNASPQFIMLSATVGNPEQLGRDLLDEDVAVITDSGAPQPVKHMLFLNPWDSAAHVASQLLEAAMKRSLRTIVYTQSRKLTELITMWTKPRLHELAGKLSSYRAGFTVEERREIEQKLATGELFGVISTSALELGIDIGDLDLCILVGYPGSIMASWQRGGRVGRGQQESAIVMIGGEDALDQYFMRNPEAFFKRDVESAVLNHFNHSIMMKHLHCAAAELTLLAAEIAAEPPEVESCIREMVNKGILHQSADGKEFFASRKYPQRLFNLRGASNQLTIINCESGLILGEIDSGRAMKECHEGAVYLHRSEIYSVQKLDFEAAEVVVGPGPKSYYTRPLSNKNTEIIETINGKKCFSVSVYEGQVRVTEQVTAYQKIHSSTRKTINTIALELPEQIIETDGLWLILPDWIRQKIEAEKQHFMGAIHALEHIMISLFPLFVLCDRNDIGGISCPVHEQTELATIFIYDGHDGGVGLCRDAYGKIDEILLECKRVIEQCDCENGCPSCVHSPKCGSGNRPIDKIGCLSLLELIMSRKPDEDGWQMKNLMDKLEQSKPQTSYPRGFDALPDHYCVFDLETQLSAEEVGGWNNAQSMRVSLAVIYDSLLDGYMTFMEDEVPALIAHLMKAQLVVGFNNKRFDNKVLSAYTDNDLSRVKSLDLLEEISNHLGYRLSLDRVAEATLERKKSGDGLQALKWYKEKELKKLQHYCQQDVELTKDLFLFGLEHEHFLFTNKAGKTVRLPLCLDKSINGLIG